MNMNELTKLAKIYPIIKEGFILLFGIIAIVFYIKSFPIVLDNAKRDSKISTNEINIGKVQAECQSKLDDHSKINEQQFNKIDTGIYNLSVSLTGINTRLSRIEGKLEK